MQLSLRSFFCPYETMRNKLTKIIKPKHRPVEATVNLPSGYKSKKYIKPKQTPAPTITYYPNGKKV